MRWGDALSQILDEPDALDPATRAQLSLPRRADVTGPSGCCCGDAEVALPFQLSRLTGTLRGVPEVRPRTVSAGDPSRLMPLSMSQWTAFMKAMSPWRSGRKALGILKGHLTNARYRALPRGREVPDRASAWQLLDKGVSGWTFLNRRDRLVGVCYCFAPGSTSPVS